jgi:hypothetical protein
MKFMKTVKSILIIVLLWIFVVSAGTSLSMYLDSKFYGDVHAEEVQDDSKSQYRVVYVFPQNDKISKLVVVHDPVWDVYCYTLQNRPYYFKTGLNCFPGWYIRNEGKSSMIEDWLKKFKETP